MKPFRSGFGYVVLICGVVVSFICSLEALFVIHFHYTPCHCCRMLHGASHYLLSDPVFMSLSSAMKKLVHVISLITSLSLDIVRLFRIHSVGEPIFANIGSG